MQDLGEDQRRVGANSDGFRTIVQPAASAGATLQAIWLIGQFHGVIMPDTRPSARAAAGRAPRLFEVIALEHLDHRHEVAEAGAGLEFLRKAKRRPHLVGDGPADLLHALLVDLDDPAQEVDALLARGQRNVSNARRAAATALSTSAAEPSAISYSASSLAGLTTGKVFLATGSTPHRRYRIQPIDHDRDPCLCHPGARPRNPSINLFRRSLLAGSRQQVPG